MSDGLNNQTTRNTKLLFESTKLWVQKLGKKSIYIISAIILAIIAFSNISSKKLVKVTVYDTKEVLMESTGKSNIKFEVGMYGNPNMYHFFDFPIKLRVDNTSSPN